MDSLTAASTTQAIPGPPPESGEFGGSMVNPVKRTRKSRGPFVVCKDCKRRFYGPTRNQKLGSHKFQMHSGKKVDGRAEAREDTQPADELVKLLRLVEIYAALKPETRKFIAPYLT